MGLPAAQDSAALVPTGLSPGHTERLQTSDSSPCTPFIWGIILIAPGNISQIFRQQQGWERVCSCDQPIWVVWTQGKGSAGTDQQL